MCKQLGLICAICASLFAFAATGQGDAPDLQAGEYIQDSGGPVDFDMHLIPISIDWNNDGAKDLIVGSYSMGNIHLYLNQGSDLNPLFATSTLIESGGSAITTSYG